MMKTRTIRKMVVGVLVGVMSLVFMTGCGASGGMNPEDTVTLPFKAEGEVAEATVKDLNIKTIALGENIAEEMFIGDCWFAFTPETEDYYCFYVEMKDEFDAGELNIHVFENKIGEADYIFGGVLSDGKEDGSYRFYTTMDGKLKAGKTYYFCYNWNKDFHLTDVHLEVGDEETFAGFEI